MQAMRSKIIDDRGAWWDAGARELRAALHLDDIQGDICTILINNLGFIGVSFRHAGVIIRFRPRTVSRAALGALLYWLTRQGCERICVSFLMDGQQQRQEILPSPRAAVLRMEALIELELGSSTVPSFVAQMGVLSRLEQGSCFSVLLDHWRSVGGTFDEESYNRLLTCFAGQRYVLFEPCSRESDFMIVRAGDGLHIPDKPYHRALTGSRLENVADRAFGQWTARFYQAALSSQQPRYDHIRAWICWPRTGRVQRRYSRLILPCRAKDGRPLLLGISDTLAESDPHVEVA